MNSVPNFTLRRDADGYVLHTDDGKDGCFPTLGAALDSLRAQGCASPATTREQVLSAARACVCGDREQDYGSPENNFRTIASLWNSYLYGAGLMENPTPQAERRGGHAGAAEGGPHRGKPAEAGQLGRPRGLCGLRRGTGAER